MPEATEELTRAAAAGRPILFRGATVLPMDRPGYLARGDVLVRGERIAAVGEQVEAPDDAFVIDATGGILMPGMIDTHRHMWQTAMRGFGADWTLTQYFVFYYLTWGKAFRPEDVYAGNLLAAIESVDSGVTTTVDWSHGLRTVDHGEAALEALKEVPARFVLAYGNLFGAPWEWSKSSEFRDFVSRNFSSKQPLISLQLAFDVTGGPTFPEIGAFESARELDLPVTTHAGVWKVTDDNAVRMMAEHDCMTDKVTYVHSASLSEDSYQRIAATGGRVSVATESEQSAGQGYPPTFKLRRYGIPVSLSVDTSVWWSGDVFSAMRATLSVDRVREHLEAHTKDETVVHNALRAEEVVRWATIGGAEALDMADEVGTITPGKRADLVLVKNDSSPTMFPILNPFGHIVFQAGRGDVHTVMVDGKVLKHAHQLVGIDLAKPRRAIDSTIEYLKSELGPEEWVNGMAPELPPVEQIPNPYTYNEPRNA